MYGPLLMLIILAPIFLIALFWAIAPYHLYRHYDRKLDYTDPVNSCLTEFCDMKYERRQLEEAGQQDLLAKLQKDYKKSRFWYKVWSDYEVLRSVIFVILCIAIFVFTIWSFAGPLEARIEVANWNEFAVIAEEVLNSSTNEIERVGVINKMLEYNEWLANARTSQKLWGNWSSYYNIDLPDPLLLP